MLEDNRPENVHRLLTEIWPKLNMPPGHVASVTITHDQADAVEEAITTWEVWQTAKAKITDKKHAWPSCQDNFAMGYRAAAQEILKLMEAPHPSSTKLTERDEAIMILTEMVLCWRDKNKDKDVDIISLLRALQQ